MFKTKTPLDVDTMSNGELLELTTNDTKGVAKPLARLRIIDMLFTILGLDKSNDIYLMMLAEPKAKLGIAIAGGGKTTTANIQIIAEKIYRDSRDGNGKLKGRKVLCLIYNRINVDDFRIKHENLVAKLKGSGVKGLNIDNELQVYTMHKFCNIWKDHFEIEVGLVGYTNIDEEESKKLMSMAVKTIFSKFGKNDADTMYTQNILTLYTFKKESMLTDEELEDTDKFIDLKLPLEMVSGIFKIYEASKKRRKVYDFTDMLEKFYELISTNEKALKEVQDTFEYIVADEVQDFTPLMFQILSTLVSNGTPLMCIGDEDQSIYSFRGADIYNALDFEHKFDGGQVFTLSRNRRCRKNILDAALNVINHNDERFEKPMKGLKKDGQVELIPYSTLEGQCINLVNKIKKHRELGELEDTVIATREREGTMLIAQMLCEEGIPFKVFSGYHAFTHELYRHMMDV